jgi:3-deoxy-7-phosphoheptulonate synthase
MLILMKHGHTPEQLEGVSTKIRALGFTPHVIPSEHNVAVGITGNAKRLDKEDFLGLDGVADAIPVTKSYKLTGRDFRPKDTEITVGKGKNAVTFGPGRFVVIAGPCAVESEDQTLRIARQVKAMGANVLRGGAYKPRTSPYAFQGLGVEGLKILKMACDETGLPVTTEALDHKGLEHVYQYTDIIQIGARNMQNFSLLAECGKLDKPVMLKRGMSATIDEWLQAAEYILEKGNPNVILCERGIRSFDPHTRNMLDLTAVPVIKELSHLPVMVDPSHGTGRRDKVAPMSYASLAVGANAIMVDVHDRPKEALCDGPQALLPKEFEEIMGKLRAIAGAMGVQMHTATGMEPSR